MPPTADTWLFGATSLIGFALARAAGSRVLPLANPFNRAAAAWGWPALDVADPQAINTFIKQHDTPPTIVYAHAVCTVSKCENNPAWAHRMNVTPLARLIQQIPATTRLVYISSDHVFGHDGRYNETSAPRPISVYGQTRIEAERLALDRPNSLVVRPGLAVGPSIDGRTGHRDWLAHRYRKGLPISIIEDEARSAVLADDLAGRLWQLIDSDRTGLVHLPATRPINRVELATRLMLHQELPPTFRRERRHQQPHPHLGRITLQTCRDDPLTQPLPAIGDALPPMPKSLVESVPR